jgi:iron complex outermembrane receptor protein
MLYLTASTGFKAGGFAPVVPPNERYDAETLTAIVLGSRNRFFDNRLQVNVEAFHWGYEDYQVNVLQPQSNGFTGISTLNAGEATIYGADLDVTARVGDYGTFAMVAEYLHTEFDSFTFDRSTVGLIPGVTTGCRLVGTPHPGPVGGNVQTLDCSGFPLQRSPEWSGSASYTHVIPLGSAGEIDLKASVQYAASRWIAIEYTALENADAYTTLDADVTFRSPLERYSIAVFGRNLTDEEYYTGGVLQPASGGRLLYQSIGAPRTYGVRLSVNF